MMFMNRHDAGKQLAASLKAYDKSQNTIVIGLPRGGVVPAMEVADLLHLPLDIICARKIGAPWNPEYAVGAVTETGKYILDESVIDQLNISKEYLQQAIEQEKQQAQRRLALFRSGRKPRNLKDQTVILVDDGLATGMTMKAAILSAKLDGAKKVVVAVPVSPWETLQEIKQLADEVVCLSTPPFFEAVGQFYAEFSQVEDEQVIAILHR
jgi:putative phosphoribosyl transferase